MDQKQLIENGVRECQENAIAHVPTAYLGLDILVAYAFRAGVEFGKNIIKTAEIMLFI